MKRWIATILGITAFGGISFKAPIVPITTDARTGKTEVHIVCDGCAYWGLFKNPQGDIKRLPMTKQEYDGGRYIKDFPIPIRGEYTLWSSEETAQFDTLDGDLHVNEYVTRSNGDVWISDGIGKFQDKAVKTKWTTPFGAMTAHAAIAQNDSGKSAYSAGNTSKSFSMTVTAGSNLILFAGLWVGHAGDVNPSCTYNSVAMTKINGVSTGNENTYLFYLVNPSTGANTLSCSWTGSSGNDIDMGNAFSGAAQSGQPDSNNACSAGAGTSFSCSTTVVASNSWLVSFYRSDDNTAPGNVANSGTTERQVDAPTAFHYEAITDSGGTVGTGSQSQGYTMQNGGQTMTMVIASFKPPAAAATFAPWQFQDF